MRKSIREKNQMDCSKRARKNYKDKNFKYQSICFKVEEYEALDAYCKENGIAKNTLLREISMRAIGKSLM